MDLPTDIWTIIFKNMWTRRNSHILASVCTRWTCMVSSSSFVRYIQAEHVGIYSREYGGESLVYVCRIIPSLDYIDTVDYIVSILQKKYPYCSDEEYLRLIEFLISGVNTLRSDGRRGMDKGYSLLSYGTEHYHNAKRVVRMWLSKSHRTESFRVNKMLSLNVNKHVLYGCFLQLYKVNTTPDIATKIVKIISHDVLVIFIIRSIIYMYDDNLKKNSKCTCLRNIDKRGPIDITGICLAHRHVISHLQNGKESWGRYVIKSSLLPLDTYTNAELHALAHYDSTVVGHKNLQRNDSIIHSLLSRGLWRVVCLYGSDDHLSLVKCFEYVPDEQTALYIFKWCTNLAVSDDTRHAILLTLCRRRLITKKTITFLSDTCHYSEEYIRTKFYEYISSIECHDRDLIMERIPV